MSEHWISVWGSPVNRPPAAGPAQWIADCTLRFSFLLTVPGQGLRLRFSNAYGTAPACLDKVTLGRCTDERHRDMTDLVPVTFGGQQVGVIPAGGQLVSDPVDFAFAPGDYLGVNLYFGAPQPLTTAHAPSCKEFGPLYTIAGDATCLGPLPEAHRWAGQLYPFITAVEGLCPPDCYSLVAFGDSITDQTWPDRFARRLLAMGEHRVAVVRRGISGSRVLREYDTDRVPSDYRINAQRGVDRFERDVLCPGAKKVIVLHGVNDLLHPMEGNRHCPPQELPTAEELIGGLQTYVDIAHRGGLQIYLSAILPMGAGEDRFERKKEAIRQEVNRWICTGAPHDGLVPFAQTLTDPARPTHMLPVYDKGDGVHPSPEGAQAMADCVPEEFFKSY